MRRSSEHVLELPPLFRPLALREAGDAFAHACAHAAELGAGALVHVGRFDLAEFAVVLEPDEPLRAARRALYAGMVALGDALAALAPPEKPIAIDWPDAIYVDCGLVGGGRLGWPDDTAEDAVPDWLVFGAMIRTASPGGGEPGLHPLATALDAEGFQDAGPERLVEGFARHFMAATDRWREDGFAAVGRDYLARLKPERGARYDIGENGDLALRRAAGVTRRRLRQALAAEIPQWLDPAIGSPRR